MNSIVILILVLTLVGAAAMIIALTAPAFAGNEQQCLKYRSSEFIVLRDDGFGGCYWLADKISYNGSGYKIASISVAEDVSGGDTSTSSWAYEQITLVKVR